MTTPTPTDQIHALVTGALDADEAARVEARLLADPETAALLEQYRLVFGVTAVADTPVAPPTLTADAVLEAARGPRTPSFASRGRWIWHAAAAALLCATALGGWSIARDAAPPTVELATLPTSVVDSAPVVDAEVFAAARELAEYDPVTEDGVQWFESYDRALSVARLTGRPVLLFIHHETCPVCITLRNDTFVRDDVRDGVREFVPLRVNVMEAPAHVTALLGSNWPYLGVLEPTGKPRERWLDVVDQQFQIHPERLVEHVGAPEAAVDAAAWDEVRAVGQAASLRDEHPGRAYALLTDTAGIGDGRTPLDQLGETLRTAIASDARTVVAAAAAAPRKEDALRMLREANKAYAGSSLGQDIDAVLTALERTGRFPRLVPNATRNDR